MHNVVPLNCSCLFCISYTLYGVNKSHRCGLFIIIMIIIIWSIVLNLKYHVSIALVLVGELANLGEIVSNHRSEKCPHLVSDCASNYSEETYVKKTKLECCVRLIIYNKNSKKKVFKTVKLSFILVQVLPYISEHFKLICKVEYLKVK